MHQSEREPRVPQNITAARGTPRHRSPLAPKELLNSTKPRRLSGLRVSACPWLLLDTGAGLSADDYEDSARATSSATRRSISSCAGSRSDVALFEREA